MEAAFASDFRTPCFRTHRCRRITQVRKNPEPNANRTTIRIVVVSVPSSSLLSVAPALGSAVLHRRCWVWRCWGRRQRWNRLLPRHRQHY